MFVVVSVDDRGAILQIARSTYKEILETGKHPGASDFVYSDPPSGSATWDGSAWVDAGSAPMPSGDVLDQLRRNALSMLRSACEAAITSGHWSSALGAPHLYPSGQTDQLNLNGNVTSSLLPGLPVDWVTLQNCATADGVWQYRPHTATQIQQAGADVKAAILQCLTTHDELRRNVAAAVTPEAIAGVQWLRP